MSSVILYYWYVANKGEMIIKKKNLQEQYNSTKNTSFIHQKIV